MKNLRFLLADLLICIPLVLLMAGSAVFVGVALPHLEAREAEWVRTQYREIATAIKEGEVKGVRQYVRGNRKSVGRLARGSWGVESQAAGVLVWYAPPNSPRVRGVVVPAVRSFDYRRPARLGGVVALVVLLALTDWGLRRFRRLAKEREDFIAATVHDLTTPLLGLELSVNCDPASALVVVRRLQHLVENLRDFLRLGGKRPPPRCENVDLVAVCREAYALFKSDYEDAASGAVEFDREAPLMVRGDPDRLVQIGWNLFGNELKYAAPYGPVRVHFVQADRQAEVAWIDTGPGMSCGQRRRAFDRYYRARTARTSGKGGFGIGLCTAREFARAMRGDLKVAPNSPRGCIFTLTLPLAKLEPRVGFEPTRPCGS